MSEAFDKSTRLLEKADFDRLFNKGRRKHGKYFLIVSCPNGLDYSRLGIAVSRKVSSRAVIRNRIKRQIREAFRKNQDLISGFDIVVIAKVSSSTTENAVLHKSLIEHWHSLAKNA